MSLFNKPTLVSITAPTCSGKNYLLDALLDQGGAFKMRKLVSTTTREPRAGEIEGVDYFFISEEKSLAMEAAGDFAELITFRGVRYGITVEEMMTCMSGDQTPVVILEPEGINQYQKICAEHGWNLFKVFINAPLEVRLSRLIERTKQDILRQVQLAEISSVSAPLRAPEFSETLRRLLNTHTDRVNSTSTSETAWMSKWPWETILPGDDRPKALELLKEAINAKNQLLT
jgi:guanylate kinase